MKRFILLLPFIALAMSSRAQETIADDIPSVCDTVYQTADEMPQFNGSLSGYFMKNFKVPANQCYIPTIYVSFVVDSKGNVRDARMLKEMKDCPGCEEQVLKLLNSMPTWKPGLHKGFPVCVEQKIPIKICLR